MPPVIWQSTPVAVPRSAFFSDPYASYPTRLVDGTIASDVAGGTTLTRNCGFGNGSFQIYKTVEFGVSDWLAGGATRRLGVLNTATYTPATTIFLPNSGADDTHRCVLQGDPSVAANALPAVVWSGANYFDCGQNNVGSNLAQYVAFRKLSISGCSQASCIMAGQTFDATGLLVEYCDLHDTVHTSGANLFGGITVDALASNPPATTGVVIRYNKIRNHTLTGGVYNDNIVGVGSYQAYGVQVYNNLFDNCPKCIFQKEPNRVQNPNGWTIRNNIFRNATGGQGSDAIYISRQGSTGLGSHTASRIYQNLMYNLGGAGALHEDANSNLNQNDDIQFYQNTIAEDVATGFYCNDFTNWRVHSNVFLSSSIHIATVLPTDYTVTAITQASSAVVTINSAATSNPFVPASATSAWLFGVAGMTQINGLQGTITATGGSQGAWTITLNINSSAFSAYTSGGQIQGSINTITVSDYNRFLAIGTADAWEIDRFGASIPFTTLAAWKLAHTNNPGRVELSADPDQNSASCVLADFPNRGTRDYTYANGVGQGQGGINIGYDPTNIGPGW